MSRKLLFAAAAVTLTLAVSATPVGAQTCTTTWLPGIVDGRLVWTDGGWTDEDRWDNGVPTASDVACIQGEGTRGFTVTLGAPATVAGLVFGSTTASIALQLNGELTVTRDGRLFGRDEIDGDLTLGGEFEVENGQLVTGGGTVTILEGGALVVVQSGGNGGNGGATRIGNPNDAGDVLRLEGGRLEVQETVFSSVRLESDGGTIAVRADTREGNATTLSVRSEGGALDGLTLDTDAGTTLSLRGDYTASGVIGGTANGVVDLSRFSTLEVAASGMEFAVGGDLGFAFSNSDSGASSELVVTTAGGEILNSGLLRLPFRPRFDGVTVRSTGTLRVDGAGGAFLRDGSQIIVEESGTLLFTDALRTGNRFIYGDATSDPGEGRIVVRGRIVEDGSNTSDGIYVPVDVEGGRLESVAGILALYGGGSLRDAELVGAEGSRLQLIGTWETAGRITGETVATPSTDGRPDNLTVVFYGLTSQTGGIRAVEPVTIAVGGGGLGIGGRVGSIVSGTLSAEPGATVTVETALQLAVGPVVRGVTLVNEGELVLNGNVELSEGTRITNRAGAETTFWSMRFEPGDDEPEPTGVFINEGLVLTTGNSGNFPRGLMEGRPGSEIRLGEFNNSSGSFQLSDNTPADSLVIPEGSFLTGFGVLSNPPRSFRLRGVVSPGTPEAPVDTLSVYSLSLADLPGSGLTIDIDAEGRADHINANQSPVYGGTLTVRAAPGFVPVPGQVFNVVNHFRPFAGEGRFSRVVAEGFPDGLSVAPDYSQDPDLNIRIGVPVSVAAEAATLAEGEAGAFVLTHPAYPDAYRVAVEVGGTATPFDDFAIGANGTLGSGVGFVRIAPGTTETRVPLAAVADQDAAEGAETVTLRVLAGGGGGGVPVEGADLATVTLGDGAAAPGVAIAAVTPSQIPATGQATITVSGSGFASDATVTLIGPATLTAEAASVFFDGAQIRARFVTSGAPVGSYTAAVASGGETVTRPAAVSVTNEVEGGTTDVWVETERRTIRDGFRNDVTIRLGNDGTADAVLVPVRLAVPSYLSPRFETRTVDSFDLPGFDRPEWYDEPIPLWTTVEYQPPSTCGRSVSAPGGGGGACLPAQPPTDYDVAVLFAPVIPAGGQITLTFSVAPSSRFEIEDPYRVDVGAPFNTLTFDFEDDTDDLAKAAFGAAPGPRPVNLAGCDALLKGDEPSESARRLAACNNCILGMMDIANAVIGGCAGAVYSAVNAMGQIANDFTTGTNGDGTWISAGTGLSSLAQAALECGLVPGLGQAAAAVRLAAFGISALTTGVGIGATISACYSCMSGNTSFNGFDIVSSRDPNDKLGPVGIAGADDGSYLFSLDRAGYTIRFENLETATASAVEVTITDSLDTSVYDLDRFSLGTVVLPDTSFTPPPGLTQWTTFWDRRPAVNSRVRISGELDRETGIVAWVLSDLDPETNRLRISADAGFLPPEAGNGEGQGSVAFQVGVLPDLPDGTVIANEADIVFDRNENIRTPLYVNTIDQNAPTSRAMSVEPFGSDSSYVVRFEGSDAGSGVRAYDLYAQASGGGPFEYVASAAGADSVVFRGEPGVTYGFFSIASDWVGNIEPMKTEAEVTVSATVSTDEEIELPRELTLLGPQPNPTRSEAVLRVGLPTAGSVRIVVYDVQGRQVVRVLDGVRPAGWETVRWDVGALAAGVYLVRVEAGGESRTQTVTVVR
jgi:hypothetical protein